MFKRTKAAVIAAAALCLLVGGCDQKSTGPGGGTVTGTVTLDGNPLQGGLVTFHPAAGGPEAIGPVRKDGTYELQIGNDKSIPAGEYLVTVDAAELSIDQEGAPDKGPPQPPPKPKRITPDKYANRNTTDLKVTVKAGANKVPLELKSGKGS